MKVLIIGGVAGGASAAARLRRLDESAEIVVLERTGFVSYANCGLPYYVGGVISDRGKLTLQTPDSFRNRFDVDVRVRNEAVSIDRDAKTVRVRRLDDGSEYDEGYDVLILSPGAKPLMPEMPGTGDPRVMTMRTVEDALAMRDFVTGNRPENAVVAGGGYIGLEVAENLARMGVRVTLVQRPDHVLPPLDRDMAADVHHCLRSNGIELLLSEAVTGFEAGTRLKVNLRSGRAIETDMAVVALGVVPEAHLASDAGLETGIKGAIITDTHMRTSDPCIYAVGDAVQVREFVSGTDAVISLAGPANRQGRIAADNICGIPSEYKGSQGSSVIQVFDMTVATTGLNEKTAKAAGIDYDKVYTYSASHATYYPGLGTCPLRRCSRRARGGSSGRRSLDTKVPTRGSTSLPRSSAPEGTTGSWRSSTWRTRRRTPPRRIPSTWRGSSSTTWCPEGSGSSSGTRSGTSRRTGDPTSWTSAPRPSTRTGTSRGP